MYALIVDTETRTGRKNNDLFYQMRCKTEDGSVTKAVIWDVKEEEIKNFPQKGNIVYFTNFKDQRDSQYANIIVQKNGFSYKKKEELPPEIAQIIFDCPKASPDQLKQAYLTINNKKLYNDEDVYKFVMACMAKIPREKLLVCPAAKQMHHAFQGGLLVHTAEVLEIANAIVGGFMYPNFINPDLVHAGATLHDIGKVDTYGIDEAGSPFIGSEENTIGHHFFAMSIIKEEAKNHPNITPEFISELLHIVAAHHGSIAQGSIKDPCTLEAIIVAQADFLSAKAGVIDQRMKKIGTVEDERSRGDNRFVMTNALKKVGKK